MTLRRLILALALMAGLPAMAAPPPPVPALPDAERRTSYSITNSLCSCSVNFALYGDSTDYQNWVEVFINGVSIPYNSVQQGWTITSPTGSLSTIPRPVTDAVLTFANIQSGTIQIVGARRPRRVSQFSENGIAARDFNQAITDLVAQNREEWDRTNDLTGRTVRVPPGETLSLLAAAATRANSTLGFDALGNTALYSPASAVTSAANVNFLQGGTGAVSRTVQAELADTVKASQFGMLCNGSTDDSAALQAAVNYAAILGGKWVTIDKSGVCPIASNIWLNASGPPGTLTVPGLKIRGQGRGVTKLDTHVANDYLISVNPAWEAAHQAAYRTTVGTSGSLGSVTVYLQITANDGQGHEILVTAPKSFSITGPSGSLSIPIPALSNPGYTYNFYCDTVSPPAHYCGLGGGDATGRTPGSTVVVAAIGSAHALPTALQAVWQEASISDLSITNSSGTANASGISYFKVGYSDLTRVYMKGLSGDGFDLFAYTGDNDGSFDTGIYNSKFDTIAGTCVNAVGAVLELTNFTVDQRTHFNICGTPPANIGTNVTVSTIPNNSTPTVTTSTAHNFQPGDQVAFNATGITLAGPFYRVGTAVTSNTFNLVDTNGVAVNTTGLGAFVSGTVSLSWRPPQIVNGVLTGGGGCLAWMGLIGTFRNLDFTQCNNFSMYFSELGSSDNATIENVDFENTAGVGAYIASLLGGTLKNFECLTTAGLGNTLSCVQLGTGFAAGGVSNFLIDVGKVRSNVAPSIAFTQFQNTNIGATFQDTNRVRNITWQAFDATNQTRVSGFVNDPIPGMVQFSISAANTAKLIPLGYGGCLPLHLMMPGEWVCYHVPSAGITGAVTGSLTPATSYNCYAYNSATTVSPYSISFECGSTSTSIDKDGYSTKSTDTTRTFIGTATTDGSGNFQTSGAQTSWYPAGNGVSVRSGKTLTVDNSIEVAGTDATKMTFPSTSATMARTDAAQTFTGTQTFAGGSASTPGVTLANAGNGIFSTASNNFGFAVSGGPLVDYNITNPSKTTISSSVITTGGILSQFATGGIGYTTGAGAAVTQTSSRTTTTPAINKVTGQVTLVSAAGSATPFSFSVANTAIAATDTVQVAQLSGTDRYRVDVTKITAGTSFDLTITDITGTTVEQPVFNFTILKGANN